LLVPPVGIDHIDLKVPVTIRYECDLLAVARPFRIKVVFSVWSQVIFIAAISWHNEKVLKTVQLSGKDDSLAVW